METVPDPYTQLSMLLPEHKVYTVLDLKDAFFSIPFPLKKQTNKQLGFYLNSVACHLSQAAFLKLQH